MGLRLSKESDVSESKVVVPTSVFLVYFNEKCNLLNYPETERRMKIPRPAGRYPGKWCSVSTNTDY